MALPSGTVTFLFTDIEGSTRLWEERPEAMKAVLPQHDSLLRATVKQHGGFVVKSTGDGLQAVFTSASQAAQAAVAAQTAFGSQSSFGSKKWDTNIGELRVRMALHTGSAELRDEDYYGSAVNRVARLLSAAHGGQIVLSRATQELIRDDLPPDAVLTDLGQHRLRDLVRPERIFQLTSGGMTSEFPPLRTPDARVKNLPAQPRPFIGREQELAGIMALLRRADVQLVTITGPGGAGKTRLALQVAGDLSSDFGDGVCFVDLAPVTEPELIPAAIADVLGVRPAGSQTPSEALEQTLNRKQMLLVIDNFEHLLDGAITISDLLRAASDVKCLTTSREALNLQEEWSYPLKGMPYPTVDRPDSLEKYGAVQLFAESARRVRPDFSLVDEAAGVIRICRLVEGMPLAIELAASWTKTLSCQDIAEEIEWNLDFLSTRMRNVPERHRSMRAAFDYSWQRLSPDEKDAFKRLSVFSGGFQRQAAKQIAGAALPTITSLVDKSLLHWKPAEEESSVQGRYRMHELLRGFAAEKLAQAPAEVERIRQSHCEYYADFLHQLTDDLVGGRQREAIKEISSELENVRAACRWAIDGVRFPEIARSAHALQLYFQYQSRFLEGADTFDKIARRLDMAEPTGEQGYTLAHVLAYLGWFYLRLGRFDQARSALQRSQSIFERIGRSPAPRPFTEPRLGLGALDNTLGEYHEAERVGQEIRVEKETLGDKGNLMDAYYVLTNAKYAQGQYEVAGRYAEESYRLAQETGDVWMTTHILNDLGRIALALEDYDQAREYYLVSYTIGEMFEDPEGMAAALNHLGKTALQQADYGEAKKQFEEGLSIFEEINNPGGQATSLHGLGDSALASGNLAAAGDFYFQALQVATEIRWVPLTLSIIGSICDLFERAGRLERSLELSTLIRQHPAADGETKEQAEERVARARAGLTSDEFSAGLERGEETSLETATTSLLDELAIPFKATGEPVPPSAEHPERGDGAAIDRLTARELEVLQLIANGLSNREIAEELVIAVGTVKSYTSQIYGKLQVASRTQAVVRGRELNLIA